MPLFSSEQIALPGHLYVLATPIGNLADISVRAESILSSCDLIACEDTRITRRLLAKLELQKTLILYHDVNEDKKSLELLKHLKENQSIAIVSDAGTPTLSDPGFRIVRECRRSGVPVVPIPGPSAFLAALSASGLPTHDFRFVGFLPPKTAARKRFFTKNQDAEYTIILYESSHRIQKCLNDLLEVLGSERCICVARELTKKHETFLVGSAFEVAKKLSEQSQKGEFVVIIASKQFSWNG